MYDNIAFEDENISFLDDDHFVAVSFGGPGKFFSLYDARMNWLSHFGDGPVGAEELEAMNAHIMLNGHLATNNGAFAFVSTPIPTVLFYKKTGDVPHKVWEDTFYDSYYRLKDKRISLDPDKTVGVVRGIELGKKYLYVLFMDVTWGDYYQSGGPSSADIVFVYDHHGNRIARLNLDHRLQDLCVSDDEKTLYGIAEIPEYVIASFDLPDFKK
jgi:hypothetical protein